MKTLVTNKKASHQYALEDRFEAGIVLKGTEIKSIRAGRASLQDSYVRIRDNEAFIVNMHVAKYAQGNIFNHDEKRTRKLLLHKKEIIKLNNRMLRENSVLIPTRLYLKEGLCKVEIALAKGKKMHDKRQSLKEKDMKRRMEKTLRVHE